MKIFPISLCTGHPYSRGSGVSRARVSIAGESHLRKIAPGLISAGTIRFATDEILYHAGVHIFSAPLLPGVARGFPPRRKTTLSLFMQILPGAFSFPLRGGA